MTQSLTSVPPFKLLTPFLSHSCCMLCVLMCHSYLPPDVCKLGKEQGQVERQLQDVVVMDVDS